MKNITEIAKMIDHSILHPTFTDADLERECALAAKYQTATVCVKPYHVRAAADQLRGTEVAICTVVGFPHGNSKTETKLFETLQAIKDGATEIDMVVNVGKVLGEDWAYVGAEIEVLQDLCQQKGAILKVIFENDFLPEDKYIIRLCEICSQHRVAFIKTSTGYGFVKGPDGKYSYRGATLPHLKLMRAHAAPEVQIKAAGGIRTLDDVLQVRALGVTRIGATATAAILEEAKKRFG